MSWNEFHHLIGLYQTRKDLVKYIEFVNFEKLNSKNNSSPSLHLSFEGNPGTGKSTVVRIMSSILKEEGILERGHLVEADRESLVGQFVGQTAAKTAELCKQAVGGVLFIDEAYTLKQNNNDAFGQEAIDTLIMYMEDFKNDFCVIMAGYPDDMEKLLSANPGIKSRLRKRIPFEDFNSVELFQIFQFIKKKRNLKVSKSFEEGMKQILQKLYLQRNNNFGNAREVELIIQKSISKFIIRCQEKGLDSSTSEINSDDLPLEN